MRLDVYLVEKEFFCSRTKARQAIERGEVFFNGNQIMKPALDIDEWATHLVEIRAKSAYVSLGGFKLEKALNDFGFDVNGLIVADVGASTGGFTDCVLQNGVKKVYAVDVSEGLLHSKLSSDDRVVSLIKNARALEKSDFDFPLDLIVADLSFISITYVLKVFSKLLKDGKHAIILIKPQFETGERKRFKNGIVRDGKIHKDVCDRIFQECQKNDLTPIKYTRAPEVDGKNLEFLVLLEKNSKTIPIKFEG